MSQEERTGERDRLYHDWHRVSSITRWLSPEKADQLRMIDIDCCEYCRKCNQPLALIEIQRSRSSGRDKPSTITAKLASLAGIEAYVVSYWPTDDELDIDGLYVRQVVPQLREPEKMTPSQYVHWLYALRVRHEKSTCTSRWALRFKEGS